MQNYHLILKNVIKLDTIYDPAIRNFFRKMAIENKNKIFIKKDGKD